MPAPAGDTVEVDTIAGADDDSTDGTATDEEREEEEEGEIGAEAEEDEAAPEVPGPPAAVESVAKPTLAGDERKTEYTFFCGVRCNQDAVELAKRRGMN